MRAENALTAALRASENRLHFAQQAGRIGLWEWDVVTNALWLSSTLYTLLGVEPGDGNSSLDQFIAHLHPQDVDWVVAELSAAVSEKRGIDIEFRILLPGGGVRWLAGVGEVELDADGHVHCMRGSNTDITPKKELEAQLLDLNIQLAGQVARQAEEQNRFWNLSAELIAKVSKDGTILSANPAALKILAKRSFAEALVPADRAAFEQALIRACENRRTVRFPARLLGPDDSPLHIIWSAACDGENDALFIIGHDMTDAIEQHNRQRESETRLAQVQKMETLGELASGIAHDFNNLLVPIVGVLDMLKRRPSGDAEFDELTLGAAQAAENARAMVRRILDFSKSQHLPARDFQPAHMLRDLSLLLEKLLPENITLRLDHAPDLPPICLPPQQLEVTLMNLVVNARDAMPDGGTVTIRANQKCQRMLFHVIDEGCGMDAQTVKLARQRFFTTKAPDQGTGLGLYMANRFAEQCGGELLIESAAGAGTTITLSLPLEGKASRRKKRGAGTGAQSNV